MRKPAAGSGVGAGTPVSVIKRGPWTAEEDEVLAGFVRREGEGRWRTLPKRAGLLRCGKSCRLRWMNYLRPSVKRGHIAADEEDLILRLHRLLGNRWSLIAGRIPGRTDNEIKNYWNTHLSKKLISQGIDPRTHKPFKPSDYPIHDNTNANVKASTSSCKTGDNRRRRTSRTDRTNPNTNVKETNSHELHQDDQALTTTALVQNDVFFDQEGSKNKKSDDSNNNTIVGFGTGGILGVDYANLLDGDDDDHLNYCSDDVFSSFVNSLINEDADQPFLSLNFEASHGWETDITIQSAFDQIGEPNRVDDHHPTG